MKIGKYTVEDWANRAIMLAEMYNDVKLNETQKYFIGKCIMEKSGVYNERNKYIELESKLNQLK